MIDDQTILLVNKQNAEQPNIFKFGAMINDVWLKKFCLTCLKHVFFTTRYIDHIAPTVEISRYSAF